MITAIKLGLVAFVLFALAYAAETRAILWSYPAAGRGAMSTRPNATRRDCLRISGCRCAAVPAITRRAQWGIPNLDLVASSGIGSYRHTTPFVNVLIADANRAAYLVAAVLRERQRNPGGENFRSFQVSEIPPVCIPLHAVAAPT